MRIARIPVLLLAWLPAAAQNPGASVWSTLEAKRTGLAGAHQVFDVQQVYKIGDNTEASKRQLILDFSAEKWREDSSSGSGDSIRIFDGKDLLSMKGGGSEFTRARPKPKDAPPLPVPYDDMVWSKAKEVQRKPCGFTHDDRTCVVLDTVMSRRLSSSSDSHLLAAREIGTFDLETGLLVALNAARSYEQSGGRRYTEDLVYTLKDMRYGQPVEASLFEVPSEDVTEVKQLSKWSEAAFKKNLVGKPAPALKVTSISGQSLDLGSFKGKAVLLDFWTTWCPPCRADAPSLDKLYSKYGDSNLMIVGISVSEDRQIVEKFLREHPHKFPIVLTTENDMPRPYQVGAFPTYIVIDPQGNVEATMDGDQGFRELKKVLKKAGMDTD